MTLHPLSRRAGVRALVAVAVLGAVALVARPGAGRTLAGVHTAGTPQGGVVLQVRDFPSAPIVEILAWNASEPAYGLRTFVKRNGAPDRYHRLWVSLDYPNGRDVAQAQGLNRPLQTSTATDAQNCLDGKCAPTNTFGARIPDGPFRSAKEDVAVKFITGSGSEFNITLRRGLVDRYLAAVDSVMTAVKK